MQSRRSHNLSKPALPSARKQAARDAALRVTQELLLSHSSTHKEQPSPDSEHTFESSPAQDQSVTEQKTRIRAAIQPVLKVVAEVVADSALQHNDPSSTQL
jgi:hypothetical protein